METALGAANCLLGMVLQKLSDDLMAAYAASSELGLNFQHIKTQLNYTHGLLHEAQGRYVSQNPGLQPLLEDLSSKADEAEDALDELHYFMIQDQLDGTQYAVPDLGGGLRGHARHGGHAVRHTTGNWLPCFSCSRTKQDDDCGKDGSHVNKLPFDRVAMSNKIRSLIEDVHALCDPVYKLLQIIISNSPTAGLAAAVKRPATGSTITQDKFHGRSALREKTINDITSGTYHSETLTVLPIVGPGGIGKTTFTQYIYDDETTKKHFHERVWVWVPTDFDVLKLTKEILSCICTTENEGSSRANETTNLDRLQKSIAEILKSKRFLIVLDDIWRCDSKDEWENLLAPFTKGEAKGSMVLVTTRFPKIAEKVMKATDPINLEGLEPEEFFTFFEECIFGEIKPGHYEDELIDIAREIAKKLKGFPLAAKTVGRLLKKGPYREHWMEVLENDKWKNQDNDDDIMSSLKISYDYLPFNLKKCFSNCALFPEDYMFNKLEITRFWIAVGIIDSSGQKNKTEETGIKCLKELVDNGFLMNRDPNSDQYYVMHDLFHELARHVSSEECVNISSSTFKADEIPPSIRHLSITINDKHNKELEEEMNKLKRRVDVIRNLQTLMSFSAYRNASISKDILKEIKGLRVLFILMDSPDCLPQNFSKLIHLRYLKIASPYDLDIPLPSTLSRLYHLKFLDLQGWRGSHNLPKDISRLVNLRHFLVGREHHSNVPEVGKMKYLQGLNEFCVKKENVGFEIRQLGDLTELGGKLSICNLENVGTKDEATEAKLMLKSNLRKLRLVWGRLYDCNVESQLTSNL